MAKKLKIYNGSSWEDVTFAITPPSTSVTNVFNTNQVIDNADCEWTATVQIVEIRDTVKIPALPLLNPR